MRSITVIKNDFLGREVFRYQGHQLQRDEGKVVLEAFFGIERVDVQELVLRQGDRFIETFYTDRWYNIFEIYDGRNDQFKGYYCNIGYPAVLSGNEVSYRDLALDLLVLPDGQQLVLDQDEFEALALPPAVKRASLKGLQEIKWLFHTNQIKTE